MDQVLVGRIMLSTVLAGMVAFGAPPRPLVGTWSGSWGWVTGLGEDGEIQTHIIHFQMKFSESGKRINGYFTDDAVPEQKPTKIKILEASPDGKSYRMNVGDECWFITLDGDEFNGVRNGGKCTKAGIGSGVQIFSVGAKRSSSH